MPEGNDILRISAEPWRPDWLATPTDGFDDTSVAVGHAVAERRSDASMRADPFLPRLLGPQYETYRTDGQRQAVRAALTMPPTGTLVVNLPTSSGKTEVALALALAKPALPAVTLIVVPTVSLAQDLERRIQLILRGTGRDDPTIAYTSDTPREEKIAIDRRIGAGTQPVVVTSPEAAVQSLRRPLLQAASAGVLRAIVIDEAHLVRQWGTSFRPDFQALAGLRDRLLEAARPGGVRTLLLSATFTDPDVDLLIRLFGTPGPTDLIAANAQRPEPEYWSASAPNETVRDLRAVDALCHLPKPAILYVSRPADAEGWRGRLVSLGLRRVAVVTGTTAREERADVLEGFRGDEVSTRFDIVIATSAFGLGISYDSVRTVIHACLPETLDRYYQEVGRGGRDGYASVSIVSWTQADRGVQRALGTTKVISWEKARARWEAMRANAEACDDGGFVVDLDVHPVYLRDGSDLNVSWNLATISLMHRAGMLSLPTPSEWRAVDLVGEAGPGSAANRIWTRSLRVRVEVGDLRSAGAWRDAWVQLRARITHEDASQRSAMEAALRPDVRLCELLSSAYAPTADHGLGVSASYLQPTRACGRCEACRGDVLTPAAVPHPPASRYSVGAISARLKAAIGDATTATVLYEVNRPDLWDVVRRFIAAACAHGIQSFVLPNLWQSVPEFDRDSYAGAFGAVFVSDSMTRPIQLPRVPTAVLIGPDSSEMLPSWYVPQQQPVVVLLAPSSTPHPTNQQWALQDVPPQRGGAILDVDDLLARLS